MNGAVRFVQGGRVVEVRGVPPTTTVLQWLRSQGRTGTKEGCAEGDCGACTVVIGDLVTDAAGPPRVRYRAVNACILFLPMLHGRLLLTVEDLAGGDGALHPVQRALVEAHASQCGFCTPGFVMSLFALAHDGSSPAGDDAVHDALAGNLCRCTGYRPIMEAARRLLDERDARDRFDRAEAGIIALLQSVEPAPGGLALSGADGVFIAPTSLDGLSAAVGHHPDAVFVAGGTDVGLWVTKQGRPLPALIHLGLVDELQVIREGDGQLDIGAAVTYARLLPLLQRRLPALGALVSRIGAAQVRNMGTLGGNIANGSPIGDTMPALLALGASLVLHRQGQRRTVPLEDFYVRRRETVLVPGEIIERVIVPLPAEGERFAVWKVSKRRDQDISAVCAAFILRLDGEGRVERISAGYGGMAATPARARALERFLAGKPWTEGTVMAARTALDADFAPLDDMRASSDYRRLVAVNLLLRFCLETSGAVPAGEVGHG